MSFAGIVLAVRTITVKLRLPRPTWRYPRRVCKEAFDENAYGAQIQDAKLQALRR